jgi:hypothetical protein
MLVFEVYCCTSLSNSITTFSRSLKQRLVEPNQTFRTLMRFWYGFTLTLVPAALTPGLLRSHRGNARSTDVSELKLDLSKLSHTVCKISGFYRALLQAGSGESFPSLHRPFIKQPVAVLL